MRGAAWRVPPGLFSAPEEHFSAWPKPCFQSLSGHRQVRIVPNKHLGNSAACAVIFRRVCLSDRQMLRPEPESHKRNRQELSTDGALPVDKPVKTRHRARFSKIRDSGSPSEEGMPVTGPAAPAASVAAH